MRAAVARASCASLELEWDEPETFGWSLEEYRVLLRRPGLPMKNAAEGLKATHTELTGLLASTTYTLFVQVCPNLLPTRPLLPISSQNCFALSLLSLRAGKRSCRLVQTERADVRSDRAGAALACSAMGCA